MAWPPRRRTTRQTRRDRNQALLARSFLFVVLGIAIGLLLMSRFAPQQADPLRAGAADVTAPFWRLLQVPIEGTSDFFEGVAAYFDSARRVRRLEAREALYQQRRREFEEALRENRELRALTGVVDPDKAHVGVFAISGATSGVYASEALIGGGRRHGVEPGQPVRTAKGLIGRTTEVGSNAARILLVTDPESRVPVRVVRTGLPALVIGTNQPLVQVDLSGPTSNEVQVGDRLVTSGDGALFSPGIPVATIVEPGGEEETPLAKPAALPSLTQFALVEEPWATNFEPLPDEPEPVAALPAERPPAP